MRECQNTQSARATQLSSPNWSWTLPRDRRTICPRKTVAYFRLPVSRGGARERIAYPQPSVERLQGPLRSPDGAMTNTKDPECLVKLQACLPAQPSGLDDVSVYRIRDIFGGANERATDQEDAAPDDGGGDQNEGPNSVPQRSNRSGDQEPEQDIGGSGSAALKSRGPVRVK
jgi:hypothetical protein